METIQDKYSKLKTEKELLQVDLQELKIESEQTKQDYHQMEEDHNKLLKKLADVEQKQAQVQDDALVYVFIVTSNYCDKVAVILFSYKDAF